MLFVCFLSSDRVDSIENPDIQNNLTFHRKPRVDGLADADGQLTTSKSPTRGMPVDRPAQELCHGNWATGNRTTELRLT